MGTVVCEECGGLNVQIKVWVDANNQNSYQGNTGDNPESWCDDCQEHHNLIPVHEFNKKKCINSK